VRHLLDGLRISQRLLLISAAFTLPLGVTVYLVVTNINANIRFSQLELYGNEYQRPLETLLEGLAEHRQGIGDSQRRVDQAFDALEEVDGRRGETLQFTNDGLAQRKRDHVALKTVKAEWQQLKTSSSDERHAHLIQDVRTMIAHVGDTSNLILDPDLDSYYTMDATLVALPQTQDRASAIIAFAQQLAAKPTISDEDRVQLAVHAALVRESDVARVVADADVALNEDVNFQGTSNTLQRNLPPAIKSYADAANVLADVLSAAAKGQREPAAIVAAGAAARDASFSAWRVAAGELDLLLQTRVDAHTRSRLWALLLSALAWICAQAIVVAISRSITGPLIETGSELGTNAQQIVSAASEVAASAQSLSQGATEQAAALEETSASMEEMSSMTRQNAEHSQTAAALMSEVDTGVQDANSALRDMVVSMGAIQESSQQVAKIIKTIDEIAFQTNILALNAAVEAARAGVAGMGFAVVADEVRSLAQRSAQAARDTSSLIEASIANSSRGHAKVELVASSMSGITDSVEKVKNLVEQVSVASREQAQGIDQVSQAITQMEKVTQTTAATAEESAAASEELNAQAESSLTAVARLDVMIRGTRHQPRAAQQKRVARVPFLDGKAA
jgi:methyl-accepting chemotaxis protein